jgi:hypothetical protein
MDRKPVDDPLQTDGRRKSMEPMATRRGVDYQQFQQFITSSTWDYTPVRRNVATFGLSRHVVPRAARPIRPSWP